MMDQESYLNELDRPLFKPKNRQKNIGYLTLNFFTLDMGLFMLSAPMMGWIDYESQTLATAYMFGSFSQYIIGFYDLYSGITSISFMMDFICSFVFHLLLHI